MSGNKNTENTSTKSASTGAADQSTPTSVIPSSITDLSSAIVWFSHAVKVLQNTSTQLVWRDTEEQKKVDFENILRTLAAAIDSLSGEMQLTQAGLTSWCTALTQWSDQIFERASSEATHLKDFPAVSRCAVVHTQIEALAKAALFIRAWITQVIQYEQYGAQALEIIAESYQPNVQESVAEFSAASIDIKVAVREFGNLIAMFLDVDAFPVDSFPMLRDVFDRLRTLQAALLIPLSNGGPGSLTSVSEALTSWLAGDNAFVPSLNQIAIVLKNWIQFEITPRANRSNDSQIRVKHDANFKEAIGEIAPPSFLSAAACIQKAVVLLKGHADVLKPGNRTLLEQLTTLETALTSEPLGRTKWMALDVWSQYVAANRVFFSLRDRELWRRSVFVLNNVATFLVSWGDQSTSVTWSQWDKIANGHIQRSILIFQTYFALSLRHPQILETQTAYLIAPSAMPRSAVAEISKQNKWSTSSKVSSGLGGIGAGTLIVGIALFGLSAHLIPTGIGFGAALSAGGPVAIAGFTLMMVAAALVLAAMAVKGSELYVANKPPALQS